MKPGPKPDERRLSYVKKYKLSPKQASKLTGIFMDQLDRCASDVERRILLRYR